VPDWLDDHELARRFPSGDPDVVAAVYERYGRAVHTVAMSFVHDRQLADDVVHSSHHTVWAGSLPTAGTDHAKTAAGGDDCDGGRGDCGDDRAVGCRDERRRQRA